MNLRKSGICLAILVLGLVLTASAFAGMTELWSKSTSGTNIYGHGIGFNPATGHLLLCNSYNNSTVIHVYDTTGNYLNNMDMGGVLTNGNGVYEITITDDGVIYLLNYTQGSVYRWANEFAAPTPACGIGAPSIRGLAVYGTGANTLLYSTYTNRNIRIFGPTDSAATTFQLVSEITTNAQAGNWSIIAKDANTFYTHEPVSNPERFAKWVKNAGVWARDSAFMGPHKRYANGMDIPSNGDVYLMEYYCGYGQSTDITRTDRTIIRVDGNNGREVELLDVARSLPHVWMASTYYPYADLAIDKAHNVIYWMWTANCPVSTTANLQMGAVQFTDDTTNLGPNYPVKEIPMITVDGNTADWANVSVSSTITWSTWAYNSAWNNAADYSGTFKMAWNHKDNRLYILADIKDENTISADTWVSAWNGEDLLELYFDANRNYIANGYEVPQMILKTNGMNRVAQFGALATWPQYSYIGASYAVNSSNPGTLIYEVSVPLYDYYNTTGGVATGFVMAPNQIIGFDVDYVDQDTGLNNAADYTDFSWTPGFSKAAYPHRLGWAILKGVVISPDTNLSLTVGLTEQFTQTGGKGTITWNSSNPSAGSIDSTGLFSTAAPGVTQITATDADGVTSLPVTVTVVSTEAPLAIELAD